MTNRKSRKLGTDNYVGDYYSAPCGWATYNRYDISHYEGHRRELDTPPRDTPEDGGR